MIRKFNFPKNFLKWGLVLIFAVGFVVSCKDYDDDIDNLQSQIDANKSAIQALQALAQSGKYIQSIKANSTGTGIIVTDSNGTSYEISNGTNGKDGKDGAKGDTGAKGDKGDKGDTGAAGATGASGAAAVVTIQDGIWYINGVSTGVRAVGTDGKDGADGKDGTNGKDGADGKDGKDGVTPSFDLKIVDGYWVINGVSTNQKAITNGGSIVVDDAQEGYYVLTVVDAQGVTTIIKLPKASLTVTSLSFIPTIENSGSPVVWFPSLTLLNGKPYYGTASVSYKVNPTSVPYNWITVEGFSAKTTMLRAAGSKDVSSLFATINKADANITDGVLKVKVSRSGTNSNTFQKTLGGSYLALCLKNDKSLSADDYVYSDYIKSYESDIYANSQVNLVRMKNGTEINLTKCPLVALNQIATTLGTAQILALPGEFAVVKGQTLDIAALLKNYITINGSQFSLNESGFEGWSYKFEKVTWTTNDGDDEVDQSSDKYSTLAADGKITAKDLYEAIGRKPLVKVTLLLPTNQVVLEKIIRIDILALSNEPIAVNKDLGTVTMACTAAEKVVDLDDLFNSSTGVGLSRAEFFALYTFTNTTTGVAELASGIYWKSILPNENNLRLVIPTGAKEGTYTFTGKFTATARPDVNVSVKVKVIPPAVKALTPVALNWENNNYFLKGKTNGSNWLMTGDLASAFNNPAVVFDGTTPACAQNMRLVYTLMAPSGTVASYYGGMTITGSTLDVPANATTWTFINHGKGTKKPIYVKVEAVYDFNGTEVRQVVFGGSDGKGFPINLVCPVQGVEAPAAADMVGVKTTLIDNDQNAWTLDGSKFFNLRSIHNDFELIYKQGVAQSGAVKYGPMTFKYSIEKPVLGAGQTLVVDENTGLVTWKNVGEALQKQFTATVKITFTHTWGTETGSYTITIKPTN